VKKVAYVITDPHVTVSIAELFLIFVIINYSLLIFLAAINLSHTTHMFAGEALHAVCPNSRNFACFIPVDEYSS
jgi:hypothetical protein